ncbi:MAG: hypothetical protein JWP91_2300 [Fibrobacteres bacterium]|nr:hypothetical protein [Fibrobacterota bacterium]
MPFQTRFTINHGSSVLVVGRFAMALFLTALPILSQDLSGVQKSLDNLEYRVGVLEGEMGKLRKGSGQALPRPVSRVQADSLVPRLSSRLDSLSLRLAAIEVGGAESKSKGPSAGADAAKPAPSMAAGKTTPAIGPAVSADSVGRGEIAELRYEIRALTVLLKLAREPVRTSPTAIPGTDATGSASPLPSDPSKAAPIMRTVPPMAGAGLDLKADIQIQGERRFATGSKQDNLDDFWGRLNFGAEYQGEGFQSKANIRIFPEGFGFEPLTGATFDTTGQGSLKVQTQPSSRIVVNHAWVKFMPGPLSYKVGRFETQESQSGSYGNYIDLGPSGRFLSRPAAHNALEIGREAGPSTTSLLLGTNERRLNRGFVRAYEKYRVSKALQAALGYRVNLFDRLKFPDEELLQRFDAGAAWSLPAGWKAFLEAAVLQAKNREDDTPVLIGIQPPTGRILDLLSLEMEWMPTRKAAGKDKEILVNAFARKSFGRLKLETALFSDAADPDANAFGLGLRMTTALK